jgi:hypothetical protein
VGGGGRNALYILMHLDNPGSEYMLQHIVRSKAYTYTLNNSNYPEDFILQKERIYIFGIEVR